MWNPKIWVGEVLPTFSTAAWRIFNILPFLGRQKQETVLVNIWKSEKAGHWEFLKRYREPNHPRTPSEQLDGRLVDARKEGTRHSCSSTI
jgi:hypothetical protein